MVKGGPDGKIYLLTGREKWWIAKGEDFNHYGFDGYKIIICEPSYLDLFKTGMII
jgi:hypothetical protein